MRILGLDCLLLELSEKKRKSAMVLLQVPGLSRPDQEAVQREDISRRGDPDDCGDFLTVAERTKRKVTRRDAVEQ